ncbi:MAG: putative Ig domain-containing protein [Pirellulaceae bacterium]
MDELVEFAFDVQATDADLPNDSLTFSLDQRPDGMEIDAVTGRITWTPQETQGPGVYNVVVRATDSTGLFDLETFTISVAEVNPATTFTISEAGQFATQQNVDIELGQTEGTRTVSFRVEPSFDRTDLDSLFSDTLVVYVVDPAAPQSTLLDRGEQGTAIFSLGENGADYVPGLVRFDGDLVTIDVTRLGTLTDGRLRFQLLNGDDDEGTSVRVTDFANVTNPNALARPAFADLPLGMTPSTTQVDPASYSAAQDIEVVVSNIHFDSTSGTYQADLALMNTGDSLSRQVILALENLPQGVTVANASGTLDLSTPYLNFEDAIPSGGLVGGTTSAPVRVTLSNPNQSLISPIGTVLSAGSNEAPIIPDIDPITVVVGGVATINLPKQDPNGDRVTYTLDAPGDLPPGTLNGILEFLPGPDDVGQYTFDLVATDGVLESRRTIGLTVTEDTVTTTRVSGQVLDVDGTVLDGMEVEIGSVRGLTDAQGRFTLDLGNGPLVSDTLKIRGETYPGPDVYPYIAEKLPLVLEREVFEGINNVIRRPIYLPKLDVANGVQIDPMQDTMVTTATIPGASVMVRAGTLMNQQSTLFNGVMSITEVPADLTPAALPDNLRPDLVLTIQPGEMVFTTPAPLTFPNTAGYEIGAVLDLWSINPVTGEFDDVGDMRVVADATAPGGSIIETISGGIRNSSWHFPTRPDPEPEPDDDGDEDNKCDECKDTNGNFEVESHSGAVLDDHGFVSYQSMGQTQGFAIHYDSQRADPRPILHLKYSNLVPRDNQRLVASLSFMKGDFEFQVPGYDGDEFGGLQGGEHFWNLDVTGTGRVALQADFTELESGRYTYNLTSGPLQFDGEDFAGTLTTQTKELTVVNTIDSPFGAGWGLYGLIELVENEDGSVLWIDGGGSELLFPPPEVEGEPYVNPAGDFSDLVKQADGTFVQTMPNQTVYTFNAENQIVTKTDRNGNTWTYSYINGIISKIEDPAGLATIFTATDGRVSSITDPANRMTLLEYDTAGNLTKITDPDNTSKQWSYDGGHRIISETDKRGFTERVFYDYAGRATKSLRADGTELMYDPVQTQVLRPVEETTDPLNPPSVSEIQQIKSQFVDSNGNVTEKRLDKQGQAVSGIDAEGALAAVGRNSDNLVTRSTNSRGSVTSYGYDASGNVTTIRDTITGSGARGVSNQGTDFWLAFMQNDRFTANKLLFISAQQGSSGNVSIPGLQFSEDFMVAPGEVTTITLPDSVAVQTNDDVAQLGVHVTSELPVSVSGLNQQQFTTDGFLGLATPVVGREYLIVSSPNGLVNGTHFAVVATADGTDVTIVPSVTTAGRSADTPYTITLNQGDVYYLQNSVNNADLTGSSISASAPISVFSGHECGNIPLNTGACDHMVEQLTPVETWGTAFATAPLATRLNGDTFRVLASTDDTDITINGEFVATLNRGEFHEAILTQPSAIIGTKPILTVQYSNGQEFDGVTRTRSCS